MTIENYIQSVSTRLKPSLLRELKFEDILHYQKIIVVLSETDRIMQEIDKIEME